MASLPPSSPPPRLLRLPGLARSLGRRDGREFHRQHWRGILRHFSLLPSLSLLLGGGYIERDATGLVIEATWWGTVAVGNGFMCIMSTWITCI